MDNATRILLDSETYSTGKTSQNITVVNRIVNIKPFVIARLHFQGYSKPMGQMQIEYKSNANFPFSGIVDLD